MPVLVAFLPGWIAQALLLAPLPLLGEPPPARLGGGLGRPAFPLDLEPRGDRFPQALECDLAVSPLAPFLLSHRPDDRARPSCEPPLLGGRENRRRFDVENGHDAGLGLLRMLAPGPARA